MTDLQVVLQEKTIHYLYSPGGRGLTKIHQQAQPFLKF